MPTPNSDPVVIIIDDNQDHAALLAKSMTRGALDRRVAIDQSILTFADPIEAIAALPVDRLAVVLLDYQLADGTALDWLDEFVKRDTGPVLILTSHGNEGVAAETFRNGAADYLVKDRVIENPDLLYQAVGQALRRHRLECRNRELAGQLKVSNRVLEKKNERLRELMETAHRFVDDVAHEFRTPLAVIQEFTAIINDEIGGPVTDRQKQFLQYIGSATRDLAQMVDDFLDSSRLKQRVLRVERKAHRVEAIFDHVRTAIEARAQCKKIVIREQIETGLPEVFCDLEKAGRTLVNLAINAIKFSAEGCEVALTAEHGDGGDVCLGVTDHGPGLTQEQLSHVCGRFCQAGTGQSNNREGFGLGLNIAAELVRLNLGRMQVASQPGQGSTFGFTLPCCDPQHILGRFLTIVTTQDEPVALSVLRVSQAEAGNDLDALRRFLASVCHPMDLALTVPGDEAVILIGATSAPDEWISRIQAACEARQGTDDHPGPLTARWLGTWSGPELDDALSGCVMDQVQGVHDCA